MRQDTQNNKHLRKTLKRHWYNLIYKKGETGYFGTHVVLTQHTVVTIYLCMFPSRYSTIIRVLALRPFQEGPDQDYHAPHQA